MAQHKITHPKPARSPSSPSPQDVFNVAKMLIEQHGSEALAVAALNAARRDRVENEAPAMAWRDVVEAIKVLEGIERPAGDSLH